MGATEEVVIKLRSPNHSFLAPNFLEDNRSEAATTSEKKSRKETPSCKALQKLQNEVKEHPGKKYAEKLLILLNNLEQTYVI